MTKGEHTYYSTFSLWVFEWQSCQRILHKFSHRIPCRSLAMGLLSPLLREDLSSVLKHCSGSLASSFIKYIAIFCDASHSDAMGFDFVPRSNFQALLEQPPPTRQKGTNKKNKQQRQENNGNTQRGVRWRKSKKSTKTKGNMGNGWGIMGKGGETWFLDSSQVPDMPKLVSKPVASRAPKFCCQVGRQSMCCAALACQGFQALTWCVASNIDLFRSRAYFDCGQFPDADMSHQILPPRNPFWQEGWNQQL